ncbi:MAG: hypothetical protein FWB98_02785 [Defluviitaleaceae bacterium]|nr:hypothetical protein [Defluviitaleaceae bacterium]
MRERLQNWFTTARERWAELEKSQKIKILAITGVVLVALVVTMILAFRTTWVPAFEGADGTTIAQISNVLTNEGIRHRQDNANGVVYVPQGDFGWAQNVVTLSPVMWDNRFTFQNAIDASGMGVTATMQHAMLTQAEATRIEDMLMMMASVNRAVVNLDVPPSHMMIAPTTPATATVMVSGNNLNSEIGENIALAVSRSVQGLSIDRIAVIDADTSHVLFEEGQRNDTALTGRSVIEATELTQRNLAQRNAVEALAPMFDEATAQANISLDWSEVTQHAIEHANAVIDGEYGEHRGLIRQEQIQELAAYIDEFGAMAIEPGAMPNDFPGGPLFGDEAREGAMWLAERDVTRDFLYNSLETITNFGAPGRLMRGDSTISVFAGNVTTHYRGDLVALEIIEDSDVAWRQFQQETPARVISDMDVTPYLVHVSMATGIPLENISLIIYDFNVFMDMEPPPPLPLATIVLLVLVIVFIGLLAFGLIRRTQPEVVEEIEPELSVEDLLVSSQLEEAQTSERERLEELRSQEDSAVKEQIDTFVAEKPEAVAQLLRNWINEDWE